MLLAYSAGGVTSDGEVPMEALDATGAFWFPGSRKIALNGRLVFDPADGTALTLFGGLSELMPNGELHEAWGGTRDCILGQISTGGHEVDVTLLDCLWMSPTSYHAHRLLIGGHFEQGNTNFSQAIIRLSDLPAWVGEEALAIEVDETLDGVLRRELRVQLDRPPVARARFNRGDVVIDFRWSREDIEYEQLTIRQWPQFEIEYEQQEELSAILDDLGHLRDLVTLCMDSVCSVESVYLYRRDQPERLMSGEAIPDTMQTIELRAAFVGSDSALERRKSKRMLLSFNSLGGIERVGTWLNEAPSLQIAIGALVTMRTESIFAENQFLNVCSGAEGFHRTVVGGTYMPDHEFASIKAVLKEHIPAEHRVWLSNVLAHANDPSLNRRLKELAGRLNGFAEVLVGEVSVWGRVVSTSRNEITHMDGRRQRYYGVDLHWLAESVFNIARLGLLLHIGMDRELLPELMKAWPLQISDRIKTTVERLDAEQRQRTQ